MSIVNKQLRPKTKKNFYEWKFDSSFVPMQETMSRLVPCILNYLVPFLYNTKALSIVMLNSKPWYLFAHYKIELHSTFLSTGREKINGVRHGFPCFGNVMSYLRSTTFMWNGLEWRAKRKDGAHFPREQGCNWEMWNLSMMWRLDWPGKSAWIIQLLISEDMEFSGGVRLNLPTFFWRMQSSQCSEP